MTGTSERPAPSAAILTRTRIYWWVKANPFGTQKECAEALSMARKTVHRHAAKIKAGWRPDV